MIFKGAFDLHIRERIKKIAKTGIRQGAAVLMLVILIASCSIFPACSSENAAVTKVQDELYLLQTSTSAGNQLSPVRELVSGKGGADLDHFLRNVRSFDYEVIGSERYDKGDEHFTKVTVRIRTYDFGSEYLAAWTDYLESNEEAGAGDDEDMPGFYDGLFGRLAGVSDKSYVQDVDIIAIEPIDNGEWITNITSNEDLQDALFGGMISEMRYLAGE